MLDEEGWLPQAKALRVGSKRRVPHDCGPGSCMIVSREPDRYSAYCFRCDESGTVRVQASLSDMVDMRRQRYEEASLRRSSKLPVPAVGSPSEWPREARLWLYKAGLSNRRIQELGFYYHPPTRRVVVPVVQAGQVVYWQARAVMKGQAPKYLNPEVDRDSVLPRYGEGSTIVLTEDVLSAIRVGEVAEGWSLMGTKIKTPVLARAVRDGRPVAVWLDPDEAGRSAADKITRTLRQLGVQTRNVVSDKDPKLLSKEEIARCLQL